MRSEYTDGPQMDVAELVEFLAGQVVDEPQAVKVRREGPNLLISVAPGEEGRLIGRQGRVIQAIRTVARSATPPHIRLNIDLDNHEVGYAGKSMGKKETAGGKNSAKGKGKRQ